MLSMNDRRNLKTLVELLAGEPDEESVIGHVRALKQVRPEATWQIVFTDVREVPAAAGSGNVDQADRWYGTALVELKIPGARIVTPGHGTGPSRETATLSAFSEALKVAIEPELEWESRPYVDADGCSIY